MNETVNLTVYQFGPISEADVVFDKYTVLIGKQGSGKSTIAKLYSMFTWLEKGLARRITSEKYITQYSRFQKIYCAYHRLESYRGLKAAITRFVCRQLPVVISLFYLFL